MEQFINFLSNLGNIFFGHLLSFLVISSTVFFFFFCIPYWLKKKKIVDQNVDKKSLVRDLFLSSINMLYFSFFTLVSFEFFGLNAINSLNDGFEYWWMIPVSWLLFIFAYDTCFYWSHRLLHTKLFFKLSHHIHHKTKDPTVFAAFSFGILESLIQWSIVLIIVHIVPIRESDYLYLIALVWVVSMIGHSGIELLPKKIVNSKFVISSSTRHTMHHQIGNVNYGIFLTFWDKIMKTEYKEKASK